MLACRFNSATTALEIESWTPGPWQVPIAPRATRLEGSGWAIQVPNLVAAMAAIGLAQVESCSLYGIDISIAEQRPVCEMRWEPDPKVSYDLFKATFTDRWTTEGCDFDSWKQLWTNNLIDQSVSGIGYHAGIAFGLILAERSAADPQGGRFYRTFGIVPEARGLGMGLRLYQSSLHRAGLAGARHAQWVCFASNQPIAKLMDRLGARVIESQPFFRGSLPFTGGSSGDIPG